jgi:hypothetical protein
VLAGSNLIRLEYEIRIEAGVLSFRADLLKIWWVYNIVDCGEVESHCVSSVKFWQQHIFVSARSGKSWYLKWESATGGCHELCGFPYDTLHNT